MTTPKTEAERRLDRFVDAADALGVRITISAKEATALFSAIFDPLPEPEPVKSLGQELHETNTAAPLPWNETSPAYRQREDARAAALIEIHEARRPKPTVEEVATAICEDWTQRTPAERESMREYARSVFPLFGVTP